MGGCHGPEQSLPQAASCARSAHIVHFHRNMSTHALGDLRAARARRQSQRRDIQSVELEDVPTHPKSLAPLCSGFPGFVTGSSGDGRFEGRALILIRARRKAVRAACVTWL